MLNKVRIRSAFSKAAASYDQVTQLHRQVGKQLLDLFHLHPAQRILDVGMGTGYLASVLAERYPGIRIYGCDIAHEMNEFVRRHNKNLSENPLTQPSPLGGEGGFSSLSLGGEGKGEGDIDSFRIGSKYSRIYPVTGDAEYLSYKGNRLDMVISNLSLQWLPHLDLGLEEIYRVLKPGGRFVLSIFGEGTLSELGDAYSLAYQECRGKPFQYAHPFTGERELARKLTGCGFEQCQLSTRYFQESYSGVSVLLKLLSQMGAKNASLNRPQGLIGRRLMQRMEQIYGEKYGRQGEVRASFQVVIACAVKPG